MECPFCGEDSRVLDSRPSGEEIRRRRECLACGRRFTTYERLAALEVRVIKRGARPPEDFQHAKLLHAVERVTRGRPVTKRACEDLVRGIEAELYDRAAQTVTSGQLAARLLDKLGELDRVAAARFASNYADEEGQIRPVRSGEPPPQLALPFPGIGAVNEELNPGPAEAPAGSTNARVRAQRARPSASSNSSRR